MAGAKEQRQKFGVGEGAGAEAREALAGAVGGQVVDAHGPCSPRSATPSAGIGRAIG
jgi:hypothetical protein